MNSQREEELKPLPCPFCGNKPEWEYHQDPTYPQVECRNIECPIGMTNDQVSLESWNTRQAATEQGVGEAVAWYNPEIDSVITAKTYNQTRNGSILGYTTPLYTHPPKPTGGGVPDEKDLFDTAKDSPERNYARGWNDCRAAILTTQQPPEQQTSFQSRVDPWLIECFGEQIARDKTERNHRFLEEALELVQSTGCTEAEANELVSYVYGRDIGDPPQEVGGVMVTLAALCLANSMDMHDAGETELARIWTKVSQIREKQKAKPAMSPLPGVYPERQPPEQD